MYIYIYTNSSIKITEIDIRLMLFAYNNVFIALLNNMQYNLNFTHLIYMYSI